MNTIMEIDDKKVIQENIQSKGFGFEGTGGGCTAFIKYLEDAGVGESAYIMITDDDANAPYQYTYDGKEVRAMIGIYRTWDKYLSSINVTVRELVDMPYEDIAQRLITHLMGECDMEDEEMLKRHGVTPDDFYKAYDFLMISIGA
jgi:hypothetical protein